MFLYSESNLNLELEKNISSEYNEQKENIKFHQETFDQVSNSNKSYLNEKRNVRKILSIFSFLHFFFYLFFIFVVSVTSLDAYVDFIKIPLNQITNFEIKHVKNISIMFYLLFSFIVLSWFLNFVWYIFYKKKFMQNAQEQNIFSFLTIIFFIITFIIQFLFFLNNKYLFELFSSTGFILIWDEIFLGTNIMFLNLLFVPILISLIKLEIAFDNDNIIEPSKNKKNISFDKLTIVSGLYLSYFFLSIILYNNIEWNGEYSWNIFSIISYLILTIIFIAISINFSINKIFIAIQNNNKINKIGQNSKKIVILSFLLLNYFATIIFYLYFIDVIDSLAINANLNAVGNTEILIFFGTHVSDIGIVMTKGFVAPFELSSNLAIYFSYQITLFCFLLILLVLFLNNIYFLIVWFPKNGENHQINDHYNKNQIIDYSSSIEAKNKKINLKKELDNIKELYEEKLINKDEYDKLRKKLIDSY